VDDNLNLKALALGRLWRSRRHAPDDQQPARLVALLVDVIRIYRSLLGWDKLAFCFPSILI
jgi:hypothetical protein